MKANVKLKQISSDTCPKYSKEEGENHEKLFDSRR